MLYCIVAEEQYNLAISLVKAKSNIMGSFTANFLRRVLDLRRLSIRDDDEDDGASRASTPSPTTYLNSLKPLDYQPYEVPTSSEQNNDLLFERQTELLNQSQEIHKEVRYIQRRALWEKLGMHKSNIDISMREFKDYVEEIEMMDVHRSGLMFTWNQKPKGSDGVLKKIDCVMANLEFNDIFAGSYAVFQPYRISDHAPCVLKIPLLTNTALRPFKFANFLVHNDRFKDVVNEGWLLQVSGFFMFRVVKKLKNLKKPLRKLLFAQGNLNENVKSLRLELDHVQKDLDADPTNWGGGGAVGLGLEWVRGWGVVGGFGRFGLGGRTGWWVSSYVVALCLGVCARGCDVRGCVFSGGMCAVVAVVGGWLVVVAWGY
ncbi:RNA-directed DNA polymerase, eukaryota, reverse transcriptase zinc-binding domain protein [Tanacetum coccineum]